MENTLITLRKAPPEFQKWAIEKGLGARDLAPLNAVRDEGFLQNLLQYFAQVSPNKNFGTQALEWAVDLHLMGKPVEAPRERSRESFMQWRAQLKDARFSQRTARREKLAVELQKASWPRNVQVNPAERGDTLGFEVKIFAENAIDFASKIAALEKCARQIKDGGDAK